MLVVKRLDGPDDSDPSELRDPKWADIEGAIERLDGETCTLLILGIGDPVPHMAIGGGKDGRYIVYATEDNESFSSLVNPNAAKGKFYLTAGGQEGEYELKMCVGLSAALRAARTYAETGQCDAALNWEG